MSHASTRNIPPPKPCVGCGRPITWRKKWERDWPEVKYCSDACRRLRSTGNATDTLEAAILYLLGQRRPDATICPSEVARAIAPGDWRGQMDPIRAAGQRLADRGKIIITQRGVPLTTSIITSSPRGPIRFGKPRPPNA